MQKEDRATLKITSDFTDFKKELCLNYLENNGRCVDGLECKYAHGTVELREETEPLMDYLDRYAKKNPKILTLKIPS